MDVKVFNNAENALNLDNPEKKQTVNPAIGNNWTGRKVAAVAILSAGGAVAAIAAVVNAIFFSQLVALVCIAAAITLLVSTILAGRIKISDDMLKLVDNLSNKAQDLYNKVVASTDESNKQGGEIKRLNDEIAKLQKQHQEEIAKLQKQLEEKEVEDQEPAEEDPAEAEPAQPAVIELDVQQNNGLPQQDKVDVKPEQNEVQLEQNQVQKDEPKQAAQEQNKPEVPAEQPKEAPVQNEQVVKPPVKEGYDDVEEQPATQGAVEGGKANEQAPENAGEVQDPLGASTHAKEAEIPPAPPLPEEKKAVAPLTSSKNNGTVAQANATPAPSAPKAPERQDSKIAGFFKGLISSPKK